MSATAKNPLLELIIFTNRVGLYPQPPTNITSDELARSEMTTGPPNPTSSSTSDFTCLLSGPLDDFLLYSRQEQSQWLIDVAHDICDPALKRGSLQVWDAAGEVRRKVNPTEPLTASTYLYDIQAVASLSKISERVGRSRTRASASGNASTMANRVKQRDGQRCWVTRMDFPITNSHICPKRMGDHLLRVVYSAFVSAPPPPTLSIYDEICGITLDRNNDACFGAYELGLRLVAPNWYECQSFRPSPLSQDMRFVRSGNAFAPRLHGYRTSPPQPQHARNPPPGLIRWHYLQCVIRKFAHSDYRSLQNIHYCELPLRMEGDSDDEGTDSECEWPSAVLDRGRAMQMAIEDREDRQRSVAEWVTKA